MAELTDIEQAKTACLGACEAAGYAHDLYIDLRTRTFLIERCEENKAKRPLVKYVGTAFPSVKQVRIQTYDNATGKFKDETICNIDPMPAQFYGG